MQESNTYINTKTHPHINTQSCAHTQTHAYTLTHTHTHTHTVIHTHTHTHTDTQTHTHTHTQTGCHDRNDPSILYGTFQPEGQSKAEKMNITVLTFRTLSTFVDIW